MMQKGIRYGILLIGLLLTTVCFGQKKQVQNNGSYKESMDVDNDLNKRDAQNRKQGTWFIKKEAIHGEPAYMTFGSYVDDKKQGLWYKLDAHGELESIQNYNSGELNGTSRYYEQGRLVCIGNFRSLNSDQKLDSIWVTDPVTTYQKLVVVPSEQGTVRHGLWRYYDFESGQLIKEERYQIDELISSKDFRDQLRTDSISGPIYPQHLPINKKDRAAKIPKRFQREIGY